MTEPDRHEHEAPIDRHDLSALKDWINAEFRVVEATLKGMDDAIQVAAREREKKDIELNDVRHRFIPRETFEALEDKVETLQRTSASTEAVNSYKRLVYGVMATAGVAFLVALFNLLTKT